jgi:hypothetical protein
MDEGYRRHGEEFMKRKKEASRTSIYSYLVYLYHHFPFYNL